jgi:hypothetical protein
VRQFDASRITVGRAMRDLQVAGLVERRAGSGTYVKGSAPRGALSFGLLIPDLGETEIFEPICQGMMASPLAREHALLWGSVNGNRGSKEDRALDLCRHTSSARCQASSSRRRTHAGQDEVNHRIAQALDGRHPRGAARPHGAAHRSAGTTTSSASTTAAPTASSPTTCCGGARGAWRGRAAGASVDARATSYREALFAADVPFDPRVAARSLRRRRREALSQGRPDAIVCANDWTAARLLRTLLELGRRVPEDVRLAGIDDVDYASLLPVPLTTLRQPTREIGAAALAAMLDRVSGGEPPPRDILLQGTLIVRRSCGSPGGSHRE